MALVSVSHLTHHYGGPVLLSDVTFDIEPGVKVGIIGQNGTGKSTLLKMIAGQFEPTEGQVFRQRGVCIAYQAQELTYAPGSTVFDEMRRVFAADFERAARLADLEQRLAEPRPGDDAARLLAEYERLSHEHEASGAWSRDREIETVLSGLGLPESAWHQRIETFSGGERNIIGLARIVLTKPDVMLLDEPSNHLDMDGIEWFIDFVRRSDAAVVMVSHNRHMLDATAREIWELSGRRIRRWAGNYSDFVQQKEEALALQERHFHAQQRLIKRLEFQARRLKDMARAYDDPGQAKRAKALEMRIEQMEKVEAPDRGDKRFKARFSGSERHGRIALFIKGLNLGFEREGEGPRMLFEDAGLEVEFGERVALVGPNGSGKTTLFKRILTQASWENPVLRLGASVKLGDYSQLHDVLDPGLSLIDWCQQATGLLFQPASELLHRFLFKREDLERRVATLSGGEKSRLQLARLVQAEVNFLMLDEPTNHLDIQACEQLEEMLDDFEGTLLVISHDRYFLDKLVSKVVEVRDRKLCPFDGSFAAWFELRHREAESARKGALQLLSQKQAGEHARSASAIEREEKKARQRELHKLRTQLRSLEEKIARLEARQAELTSKVEQAFTQGGGQKAFELSRELEQLGADIHKHYAEWERLSAEVEP